MALIDKEQLINKIEERKKELLSKPRLIANSYYAEEDANIIALIHSVNATEEPKVIEQPEKEMFYRNLSFFSSGDIIYSPETKDYYAALFRMPENYNGEDYFKTDYIVYVNETWTNDLPGTEFFDIEPGLMFRLATEEEKKIFNDIFKKK